MSVAAIIGAGFGDEGKGRMTDTFAFQSSTNCVVVRSNGGPQAGHTVVRPDGVRHTFGHFGSGTFAGAVTYLSEYFLLNPLLWHKEEKELRDISVKPIVYVNPSSPVTTPYDMFINREVERFRGDQRHGSCGYGVSETVERLCKTRLRLFFRHIGTPKFKDVVKKIRFEYVLKRLRALGITTPSMEMRGALQSNELMESFIDLSEGMERSFITIQDTDLKKFKYIIFEGSQGLCLDEEHPFFPHVSRSRTGLANVSSICHRAGIKDVEVVYVMRAYMTRHGAGPFPTEVEGLSYPDATNVKNEFQGPLRFGHLDVDLIRENINRDLRKAKHITPSCSIAVTCLDQVGDVVSVKYKRKLMEVGCEEMPKFLGKILNCQMVYTSRSESRAKG
jgi:adenylosuccinate synthase